MLLHKVDIEDFRRHVADQGLELDALGISLRDAAAGIEESSVSLDGSLSREVLVRKSEELRLRASQLAEAQRRVQQVASVYEAAAYVGRVSVEVDEPADAEPMDPPVAESVRRLKTTAPKKRRA